MTPDEHPLDRAERPELDPSSATLWGIMVACLGLAVLAEEILAEISE